MRKSCKYCGRIHPSGYECPKRPQRRKQGKRQAEQFRSTYAWQKKRGEIKQRDHYLCVYNLAHGRLVYEGLEVHHIIPIEERPDLALEDNNLITLSQAAHELAERGEITRGELAELVRYPPGEGTPSY